MRIRQLSIPDAYEFTPQVFPDSRGLFSAPYQEAAFAQELGFSLHLAQVNSSVSHRGVVRGIHFADTPPGQGKYVYCTRGQLLDVIVDLREGSPTFGQWDSVLLDAVDYRAVYLAEGLGHAFVALADDTVMSYLCSAGYNPSAEHGVNPLDAELNLPWPTDVELTLSEKDSNAPSLAEAHEKQLLPRYADCVAHYEQLRQN